MTFEEKVVYAFVYQGQLTEEALDKIGRKSKRNAHQGETDFAAILALDVLDDQHVNEAQQMAHVYVTVAAFENSVRSLISQVLLEEVGTDWWQTCVSEKIRNSANDRINEENKFRWHGARGADPIYYTLMKDLVNIIQQNWAHFEPYIPTVEWARSLMDAIERSRNVIMHSGSLSREDMERVGIYIRDWVKQVGA